MALGLELGAGGWGTGPNAQRANAQRFGSGSASVTWLSQSGSGSGGLSGGCGLWKIKRESLLSVFLASPARSSRRMMNEAIIHNTCAVLSVLRPGCVCVCLMA